MTDTSPNSIDLSNCNVSTDGGKTTQTLAEISKSINNVSISISDMSNIASNSKKDVEDIKAELTNLYGKKDNFKPNGILPLDNTGQFMFQPPKNDGVTWIAVGWKNDDIEASANPLSREIHLQYSVNGTQTSDNNKNGIDTIWDDGSIKPNYAFGGISFHPQSDGVGNLGRDGNSWNNIYSKTAVNVTSDKNVKKIVSTFDEKADDIHMALMESLYDVNVVSYKLKDAIREKGEERARIHTGFIAQDIERAIKDAGLDPSDYAMWTQDTSSEFKMVDTGEKDKNGNPVLKSSYEPPRDEKGDLIYRQKLRYTELICMLLAAHKQKINGLEARLLKLEGKK